MVKPCGFLSPSPFPLGEWDKLIVPVHGEAHSIFRVRSCDLTFTARLSRCG